MTEIKEAMLESDGYLAPNPTALNLTFGFGKMEKALKLARGFTTFDIDRTRRPHVQGDFRQAPFKSGQFKLILYDPPHLTAFGSLENIEKFGRHPLEQRYGAFENVAAMRKGLYLGFREIARMLTVEGDCLFKWNEYVKSLKWALSLLPQTLRVQKIMLMGRRQNKTRNQGTYLIKITVKPEKP